MKVYHEANPKAVDSILREGLQCTSRGDKGDDQNIIKADYCLDSNIPGKLKALGVSRDNNLYAFVNIGDRIISITNGQEMPIQQFLQQSNQAVFCLEVDPGRCFVSDLDIYDQIRQAIKAQSPKEQLAELSAAYWQKLTPLSQFKPGQILRPEIMITYDLPPDCIKLLKNPSEHT